MLTKITTQHMGLNLTLEGLARVNYFVGANGAGKTRLMKSIKRRMSLYIDQADGKSESEKIPVNFYSESDGEEYEISKDGALANHLFDLDLFMVQGDKRTALALSDEFKSHPLTQKIIHTFHPGKNFDLRMGEGNKVELKDAHTPGAKWIALDDMAAGFQSLFKLWNNTLHNKLPKGPGTYILSLDEVDRHLHPTLAKQLPSKLEGLMAEIEKLALHSRDGGVGTKVQAFVTTHSPFTVRGALENEDHKIFHLENGLLKCCFDRQVMIENFGTPFDNVLADLGFKMQDLYYPEALICIEGPVDALYLHYWLDKFLEEQGLPSNKFVKGVHYDFLEFGCALAAHLAFKFNADIDPHEMLQAQDLVNIFSLNRKVFLMVDNDAKNAFEKTKGRLKHLVDQRAGCVFYRNEQYTTIECLLTDATKYSRNKSDKLRAAVKNLQEWRRQSTPLKEFNPEVYPLMEALYAFLLKAVNPQLAH
jgi:hypothetical protein